MKFTWQDLTIVTSCVNYGKYLLDWARSIQASLVYPGAVKIFTHGQASDKAFASVAADLLRKVNIDVEHVHHDGHLDFGTARNRAVAMSASPWVMHLDADDKLLPHGLELCHAVHVDADVVSAGYTRIGISGMGVTGKDRVYQRADGLEAFTLSSICSGCSPFKRSLWERQPYRTDMLGAWDTAFWFSCARQGARFRPTTRAVFQYRQHSDSIFNRRRTTLGWARVRTTAQLKALRRNYSGVDVIFPLSTVLPEDRRVLRDRMMQHYRAHHPSWRIVQGMCDRKDWSKGAAIFNALERSTAEILVLADADCVVNPTALQACVDVVKAGAPWAVPHVHVCRLNAKATTWAIDQRELPWEISHDVMLERARYVGKAGGGITVISRVNYDSIGGIPLAFAGWGSEDEALALLCDRLLGPCTRGLADLIHFHHEPQWTKREPGSNVRLLRSLGLAAQHGIDSLVQVAYTIRTSDSKIAQAERPIVSTSIKRASPSIDVAAISARRESISARHRRG